MFMKTSTLVWIVIILVILVGGWYIWMQGSVPAPAPTTSTTSTSTTATSTGTSNPSAPGNNLTLGTDSSASIGAYLIGDNGMTLYTYSRDKAGVSNCTGSCAQAWPPYTIPVGMTPNLQAGVTGAASTITRADGTVQVTYKGMPLYFFVGDTTSGAVTGNGQEGFTVAKP